MRLVLALMLTLLLAGTAPVSAQTMFLDVTGDGLNSASDKLSNKDVQAVDIWIATPGLDNVGRLKSTTGTPDINAYEVLLHASEGTVEWLEFTNRQPAWGIQVGPKWNDTDYYIGFFGEEHLPAGKYLLGTVRFRVVSGTPSLDLAETSPGLRGARTSFASSSSGLEQDNALKFTRQSSVVVKGYTLPVGDWHQTIGIQNASVAHEAETLKGVEEAHALAFSVRVIAGMRGSSPLLRITTTRPGKLHVRLYDVLGRLVCTPAEHSKVEAGTYSMGLSCHTRPETSGVFFYKVETDEREATGKIVMLK